jgi:hypothetical protein
MKAYDKQEPTLGDLMNDMAGSVEKFWAASAAFSHSQRVKASKSAEDCGAEDRGAADSYYQRAARPHKLVDGVEVLLEEGTPEWSEYMQGFYANELLGNFKQW